MNMRYGVRFSRDVLIAFSASLISMVLNVGIGIILARCLGADGYGLYKFLLTLYSISIVIFGVGIPAAMVKFVSETKEDAPQAGKIITTGVIASLLLGIICTLVIIIFSGLLADVFRIEELSSMILYLAPIFPFSLCANSLLGTLNGLRRMRSYAIAIILQNIALLISSLLLISLGFGVAGVLLGLLISIIIQFIYLLWQNKTFIRIAIRSLRDLLEKILAFGSKLMAVNFVQTIVYNADIMIIGYLLTVSDVGYYGIAMGLSKLLWVLPSSVQMISYPAVSEFHSKKNISGINDILNASMKYTAIMVLPAGLILGLFAADIIHFIFGIEFEESIAPLYILSSGIAIASIWVSIGSVLSGVGRPDIVLRITILAAIIDISMNLALIPIFGINGAAIAAISSYLFSMAMTLFFIRKIVTIDIDYLWLVKISSLFLFILSFGIILNIKEPFRYLIIGNIIILFMIAEIVFFLKQSEREALFLYLKDILRGISKSS